MVIGRIRCYLTISRPGEVIGLIKPVLGQVTTGIQQGPRAVSPPPRVEPTNVRRDLASRKSGHFLIDNNIIL